MTSTIGAAGGTSADDLAGVDAIAVIGMAGRFPGADSVSQFWRNLRDGVESIVSVSESELSAAGVSDAALANPAYVRRAALMDGIDEFDAEFFGFTPHNARMMDPQHRIFLQCAWHALEDAGVVPADVDGPIGVYGTSSASGYLLHNLMSHHDPDRMLGQGASFDMINLSMQNDKDYLATRVAHQFDLRGPALAVQTACSSSLVAVHLAINAVLSGEVDVALAGAASIRVPHRVGYWHEPGAMVSASGHCRPFDVRSDGTVFGSGAAVVVLKGLQAALDDGDHIRAVIRGSAINNDGSVKMNYAAPTAAGQAEAIAEAHAVAGVDASTIGYVETHGTGTPLGDPIEIEGLRQAFALATEPRRTPCVLGSVKSNIGHLEVASGIAGLVKAVLCLEHRGLPGTLHFSGPNPELHLDRSPFEVRGEYRAWESDGPRRAGVSSFGVGGTNVHLVLEEAPTTAGSTAAPPAGPQVLLLSARSADALAHARTALAGELADTSADTGRASTHLADVAHTLAARSPERVRLAAVIGARGDAAAVLGGPEHDNVVSGEPATGTDAATTAWLFPGQGAQHPGMARGLYDAEPVFAQAFDACAAAFASSMGLDLRDAVFGGGGDLERTDRTQPALFAVEYALARLLQSHGVTPAALAGHSIGEYVAATVAGIFDLPTAAAAVAMRARLMNAAPRGVMVAVAAAPEAIADVLRDSDVDLAAVNDSGSCVVAGTAEAVGRFTQRLAGLGVVARRVRTSHAFHSRLMEPVLPEFTAFLSRLTLSAPQIPLLSNVTGTWMTAAEATDPAMWARQIRSTVHFAGELDELLADPARVVVEVGPGGTLTASAKRHARWGTGHRAVRLMRHPAQTRDDHDSFLLGLGGLWAAGVDVDWTPRLGAGRTRVSLPGYAFERTRHWVEHSGRVVSGGAPPAAHGVAPSAAEAPGVGGVPRMEMQLARIWGQCLGLSTVDRHANFFEIGGDSLIAISVAMTAGNEGLDLTPQDLYESQTVAALATRLTDRYAGGLSRHAGDVAGHPLAPPNVVAHLEEGLVPSGRWRVPLVLELSAQVSPDDVRAVLAAVVAHHDALRVRFTERAGSIEQRIADPDDLGDLAAVTVLDATPAGGDVALVAALPDSAAPLVAVLARGGADGAQRLVLGLHGTVGDVVSGDLLLTDLFTAFGQRLGGQDIALVTAPTSWAQWSHRCAALSTHPAVLDSAQYWLDAVGAATVRLATDTEVAGRPPTAEDLVRVPTDLGVPATAALDDARRRLRTPVHDLLLAALGAAAAGVTSTGTATGEAGVLVVDVEGSARQVLRPDVDLHRTVGSFATVYPVAIPCATTLGRATVDAVGAAVRAVPHGGVGYGLLRHAHAPTARRFAASPRADVFFTHLGSVPDLPEPTAGEVAVGLSADTAFAVRERLPGLGHAVELRAYRVADRLHLDWWYDRRRVDAARIAALVEAYPAALAGLLDDAPGADADDDGEEMTFVDLGAFDDEVDSGLGSGVDA